MLGVWFPDLLQHVRNLTDFAKWYDMPASKGNQLVEMLALLAAIGVVYRLIKELGKDALGLLHKIHDEIKSITVIVEWVNGIRKTYPNANDVIEKLRQLNGNKK